MKEEIRLVNELVSDIEDQINSDGEDNPLISGASDVYQKIDCAVNLLSCIKFSIECRNKAEHVICGDVEPWDPEGDFEELEEEYEEEAGEDNEDEPPEEAEK